MAFGSYPLVSLAGARMACDSAKRLLIDGGPIRGPKRAVRGAGRQQSDLALVALPGLLSTHYGVDNGFVGRIVLSGHILDRFDASNWLGLKTPDFVTSDSGYAYVLAGVGVFGIAIFWTMLMMLRARCQAFYLMRDLTAAYFAVLLCISNSPFTIKTGALLWFLIGVLSFVHLGTRSNSAAHYAGYGRRRGTAFR